MFDKDLFLSICEKYDVEFSQTADSPMLREGEVIHSITSNDVNRVFSPCQTFFGYTDNKVNTKIEVPEFCLEENYAIAC